MSLERILQILADLELTKQEIRVYIYLAKEGPKTAKEIAQSLNINKRQLYQSLAKLKKTGLIKTKTERAPNYAAITFEKTVDLLIKSKIDQARNIKKDKKDLLMQLKSLQQLTGSD